MVSKRKRGMERRDFLRVGTVAGLSLAEIMRLRETCAAEGGSDDVNCIFIFIIGGMPHQDMWDLKPAAPVEIRGDFTPISTSVPGVQISDVLPKTAGVTDRLAILRSLTHSKSVHQDGYHAMMTGKEPTASLDRSNKNNNQHPSIGSLVAKLGKQGAMPPYISVPNFIDSGGPSFLGPSHGPFVIDADPAAPEFEVRDITLPVGVDPERSLRRQTALREINQLERASDRVDRQVNALDSFYQKAFNMMTSRRAKEAFNISVEQTSTRESYGMTSIGQCCLLGRRLVEAGCRFVSIENGHWDTHRKNTKSLRELLCPAFDQAIPALLNDLSNRGMLEKTLVVISTEFGRTPRINPLLGRDHWPNAFSIVMAGAGLNVGQTIGATDKQAASVVDRPISPADVSATILKVLGIDHKQVLHTPLGRPVPVVDGGKPISELFV